MISRTELLSAWGAQASAAKIAKAFIQSFAAFCAGRFGRQRRGGTILALSDHQLRDLGVEHPGNGDPIPYDLLDLMPRGAFFGHRRRRWL
jgi:uncharacterized protein YjiS (DUF1127 family)